MLRRYRIFLHRSESVVGWETFGGDGFGDFNANLSAYINPLGFSSIFKGFNLYGFFEYEGFAYVVTTTIEGKRVLRLCLINGNTDSDDVIATVERLDEIARELCGEK